MVRVVVLDGDDGVRRTAMGVSAGVSSACAIALPAVRDKAAREIPRATLFIPLIVFSP